MTSFKFHLQWHLLAPPTHALPRFSSYYKISLLMMFLSFCFFFISYHSIVIINILILVILIFTLLVYFVFAIITVTNFINVLLLQMFFFSFLNHFINSKYFCCAFNLFFFVVSTPFIYHTTDLLFLNLCKH